MTGSLHTKFPRKNTSIQDFTLDIVNFIITNKTFLRKYYKTWMRIKHMMGINFNDDYNDGIIPLLPFPLISFLTYDYLNSEIKDHSSIKVPRFLSQYLCLSKITINCVFYINNLYEINASLESDFVY